MMKRILSFILSIVMVFLMLPLQALADELPEVEIIETQAEEPAVETTAATEEATEAAVCTMFGFFIKDLPSCAFHDCAFHVSAFPSGRSTFLLFTFLSSRCSSVPACHTSS